MIEPCQFLDFSSFNMCSEDRDDINNELEKKYKTYEEALEEGLKKGLNFIKKSI